MSYSDKKIIGQYEKQVDTGIVFEEVETVEFDATFFGYSDFHV